MRDTWSHGLIVPLSKYLLISPFQGKASNSGWLSIPWLRQAPTIDDCHVGDQIWLLLTIDSRDTLHR